MDKNFSVSSETLYKHRWLALFVLLIGAFMVILDSFIVNVAIPTIQEQLKTTATQIQFIVVAYVLAYAVLLIMGARLGDKFGRKKLFIVGMCIFIVSSTMCGFATNTNFLILSRVIQGIGAAFLIPQVLTIIQIIFPPEEKGKAIGLYGAVSGLGLIGGQIIGGILLHSNLWELGWRSVFLINIPIGILAVIFSIQLLPESRSKDEKGTDWLGMFLLTSCLILLVYPLVMGRELGWPFWVFLNFIGSFLLFIFFFLHEKKMLLVNKSPLIPVKIFSERVFSYGILTILAFQIGNGGFFLTTSLTLQDGLSLSAMESALAFIPIGIGFFIACLIAPILAKKTNRSVLIWGSIVLIIGYIATLSVTYYFGKQLYWPQLIVPFFLIGTGQGLVGAQLMGTVLSNVQKSFVGSASGILSTFMQIANVLGIAIIGSVYFISIEGHLKRNLSILVLESYLNSFNLAVLCSLGLSLVTLVFIVCIRVQQKESHKQVNSSSKMQNG